MHQLLSLTARVLSKNKLSILIFHQVLEQGDLMRPSEPDSVRFTWQMQLIKRYFHPLPLSVAINQLANGNLPRNAICITFDDGYINNLTVAAPILNALDIPATVFVATQFCAGENMWNDRLIDLIAAPQLTRVSLSAMQQEPAQLGNINSRIGLAQQLLKKIKYLPYRQRKLLMDKLYQENQIAEQPPKMMSPEQLTQLSELGIEIGAHTQDHPILKGLSKQQQLDQIRQSKQTLEAWLGQAIGGFAYPNGKYGADYDDATASLVAQLDFSYAVSTNWGISDGKTDKFQLKRFTPWDKNQFKFHLRLLKNLFSGR